MNPYNLNFSGLSLLFILWISFSFHSSAQKPGSGGALEFNGGNDYVDLGTNYQNLSFPISISAWVRLDNGNGRLPIFKSSLATAASGYTGVNLHLLNPTHLSISFGDGGGSFGSGGRRSKAYTFSQPVTGQWMHVVGIINSALDMRLYVNGIDVGGSYSGFGGTFNTGTGPASINRVSGIINGSYTKVYGEGKIDELSIWNKALTQTEIRDIMCKKLIGNEANLLGYYRFDSIQGSTLINSFDNTNNGVLMNSPDRIVSGAPIGNQSVYSYSGSSPTTDIHLITQNGDSISVHNYASLDGVQLYLVDTLPNYTDSLNPIPDYTQYFGVFPINSSAFTNYDLDYYYNNTIANLAKNNLTLKARKANNDSIWLPTGVIAQPNQISLVQNNGPFEWFPSFQIKDTCLTKDFSNLNLGSDTIIFDYQSIVLDAGSGFSNYQWNTSDSIQVISLDTTKLQIGSNLITVFVTDSFGCSTTDSIRITVQSTIGLLGLVSNPNFSLYPNPTSGEFFITSEQDGLLKIIDLSGRLAYQTNTRKGLNNIHLALTKGLYIVQIYSESRVFETKLIVH